MDTVERSAIIRDKEAQSQDGDLEMGVRREKDHKASATGK
jgi:hypothetical protein